LKEDIRISINLMNNITKIQENEVEIINLFNHFYFGASLPNISKEIDLVRFGKNYNINIELKCSYPKNKTVKEQLEKNAYYFKFLRKNTFHYTYIEDKNRLYRLEDEELVESKFENLLHLLEGQEIDYDFDFYNSFDPNNYLVSPFNDTERFLKDEYYLTDRQDEVKSDILKNISTEKKFINIQGGFGSGKSLVLYDVSKQLQKKDFKCLIIHCGKLNDGHTLLRTEFSKIDEIKNLKNYSLSKFDWILFDEVQRLKESQLNDIMKKVKGHSQLKCIFSGDPEQWLKEEE